MAVVLWIVDPQCDSAADACTWNEKRGRSGSMEVFQQRFIGNATVEARTDKY